MSGRSRSLHGDGGCWGEVVVVLAGRVREADWFAVGELGATECVPWRVFGVQVERDCQVFSAKSDAQGRLCGLDLYQHGLACRRVDAVEQVLDKGWRYEGEDGLCVSNRELGKRVAVVGKGLPV